MGKKENTFNVQKYGAESKIREKEKAEETLWQKLK